MKNKYIWIVVLLFCLFLVGAKNQSVTISYYFAGNIPVEKSVDFSSLLLKVNTDKEATCRYDDSQGISYGDMEGRFDLTYGTLHEKSITGLGDGVYKYYIRCIDNSSSVGDEMELIIRVSSLVTGQIVIEEEEPLRDGRYEVTLVTSKIVSQAPSLSASFDGVVYDTIPLIGSEKIWKGYLIVPKNSGEGVVSFKFTANDLEGRQGSEIISGGAYLIDTVRPYTIPSVEATGYKGEIKIEWYLDEDDIDNFKIYRSLSPEVKNTDFYAHTEKSPFYDSGVEDGETYYYKVSAVDEAGNEGDLSVEVYSTALLSETVSSTGLDIELIGKVDNFLKELDLFIDEIEDVESSVQLKQGKEKELFDELALGKEIEGAKSEADVLKKDVEKYKLQDLSENELDNKINSARVKMNIIKKKIPESITILSEDSVNEEISDSELEEAILEIQQGISDKAKEESVKRSLKLIKDSELEVRTYFYIAEIIYIEGTKKTISIVKRTIDSKLEEIEWNGDGNFIEKIPKTVVETTSEIEIKGLNYRIVKEDPVLAFGADSKEIFYYFNKEISLATLKDIDFTFVSFVDETTESEITGYFLVGQGKGSAGIVLGITIILGLSVYFIYLKKGKGSEQLIRIEHEIKQAYEFLEQGEREKAIENYRSIRELYDSLDEKEKKKAYKEIEKIFSKITEEKK